MKLIPLKFIKCFIPPSFLISLVPGLRERIRALEIVAFAFSCSRCLLFRNLGVALVEMGMKKGVSIFPDFVFRMAILAFVCLSLRVILNVIMNY